MEKSKRTAEQEIISKLKEYGLSKEAFWDCHGTWVIYHWALEHVAAAAGMTWEGLDIIQADLENRRILIRATGRLGNRVEMSFGEATPPTLDSGKRINHYPVSMAEKRAKDRVILKLVGLHGLAYSEDEAPEFQDNGGGQQSPPVGDPPKTGGAPNPSPGVAKGMPPVIAEHFAKEHYLIHVEADDNDGADWPTWNQKMMAALRWCPDRAKLEKLWRDNKHPMENVPAPMRETLKAVYEKRLAFFSQAPLERVA